VARDGELRDSGKTLVGSEVDGTGGAVLVDKVDGAGRSQRSKRGGCGKDGGEELHLEVALWVVEKCKNACKGLAGIKEGCEAFTLSWSIEMYGFYICQKSVEKLR